MLRIVAIGRPASLQSPARPSKGRTRSRGRELGSGKELGPGCIFLHFSENSHAEGGKDRAYILNVFPNRRPLSGGSPDTTRWGVYGPRNGITLPQVIVHFFALVWVIVSRNRRLCPGFVWRPPISKTSLSNSFVASAVWRGAIKAGSEASRLTFSEIEHPIAIDDDFF